ncbi:hypothetical protein [Nocardia blacklockiae]|uniref:hypothetical protein n=1 Tax=Nocardia blacklockiae TaxID=480036 RepID=UPI001892F6C2|nr:hypothetical protein [Nocardia blacklockiae]MBF6172531.1 hypothetical protein [Nocardia blacklockiae]
MADRYIDINTNPAALAAMGPEVPRYAPLDVGRDQSNARSQQQGAEQLQTSISYDGKDPDYITRMEQFEGRPHAEIYANAQKMDPGTMHDRADVWISISHNLSGGLLGMHMSIQKALAEGIDGKMADAALAAAQKFYQQAFDVQEVIQTCGHRIKAAAHAAEVVRMSVPPPASPLNGPESPDALSGTQVALAAMLSGLASDSDGMEVAYQRGVEALHRAAIDTMNNQYKPTYGPAGSGIPTFVPVQAPGENGVDDGAGGVTPGGINSGSNGPAADGNGGENARGDEQAPGTDPASVDTAGLSQDSQSGQQQSGQGGSATAKPTSSGGDASTTAAGVTSGSAGRGGSPGGAGLSGRGGTAGGPGGVNAGGSGRSVPGSPGTGNAAAAATLAGGAAAARAGAPGMMGPGGGGGKQKGESESDHRTPDWLIRNREDELIGTIDPTVPQAIGADIPAAQSSPRSHDEHGGIAR